MPEYRNLSRKAISVIVPLAATYFFEEGFSVIVEIKSKKRNSMKEVDLIFMTFANFIL